MLQQGWLLLLYKGVKGDLFSLGGSEPLGLLIGLWTCDLAGPRQLLEIASHRPVL